jgi:hypothetical protein
MPCFRKRFLLEYFWLRCVMQWIKERDALIAQTLAFVQSVTGKKPDAEPTVEAFETAVIDASEEKQTIEHTMKTVEPRNSVQVSPVNASIDFRSEMQARVANFRAHQERFNREREAYCSATLAKARAGIANDPSVPLHK